MKTIKKTALIMIFMMTIIILIGCQETGFVNPGDQLGGGQNVENIPEAEDTSDLITDFDYSDSNTDLNQTYSESDPIIILNDEQITFTESATGIEVMGTTVTITEIGTYVIEGTLTNGRIIVNVNGNVHLILNGVNITSNDGAPIIILGSKKKVITLNQNTINELTDASTYTFFVDDEDSEPNGALFSKKALTINGTGTLIVHGNYNNGISVKDTLKILSGTIIVDAQNHALKGNDAVIIKGGHLSLTAANDGIQSDKESETTGIVYIENATLNINAQGDGIQAYQLLQIESGTFDITTFGGSQTTSVTDKSAKGLKSDTNLLINGGTFVIDSYDDAIHSNGSIIINGGAFELSTQDDAIHVNNILEINDGNITIIRSYEGLEAAKVIINAGIISIVSSDDGINAADDTELPIGQYNPELYIIINGGHITISASGDGIDSNGTVLINGGEIYINGPTASNNGSLDADGGILVNGGLLVAVGPLGMVETPGTNSEQNTVSIAFSNSQSANQIIEIKNDSNQIIASFTPSKTYRSLIVSTEDLLIGSNYTVWINGVQVTSFKQTSVITYVGSGTSNPRR